jgi:hypothetical protein
MLSFLRTNGSQFAEVVGPADLAVTAEKDAAAVATAMYEKLKKSMGRRALLATVTCGWEGSGALLKAEDMSVDSWKIYSSVIPDLRNCSYRKSLRTDVD